MTTYSANLETFADSAMNGDTESYTNYIDIIETVISSLEEDQSAMVSHTEDSYLWRFRYGSVEVFVQLTGMTDDDTFKVWSAVMDLPAKEEAKLFRKLLELNWAETFEARFSIVDDRVVVSTDRTVAELSPAEVSRNITVVATIADDYDDPLQAEFGMS
jgi:hypothetical protein